jgi:hypothetical protein
MVRQKEIQIIEEYFYCLKKILLKRILKKQKKRI